MQTWNIWEVRRESLEDANQLMLPESTPNLAYAYQERDRLAGHYPQREFHVVPIH